jgi:hypothetical protein
MPGKKHKSTNHKLRFAITKQSDTITRLQLQPRTLQTFRSTRNTVNICTLCTSASYFELFSFPHSIHFTLQHADRVESNYVESSMTHHAAATTQLPSHGVTEIHRNSVQKTGLTLQIAVR